MKNYECSIYLDQVGDVGPEGNNLEMMYKCTDALTPDLLLPAF